MFVSIIIPTYNRADKIGVTIESFMEQTYPRDKYELIVCDNNSTDNLKEVICSLIKRYGNDRISYLLEKRQGVHFARNTAAKHARGDILYFTDDDMVADSRLLEKLIPVFETESKIGCATGRVLPKWECPPPGWIKKYCSNGLLSLMDLGRHTLVSRNDIDVYSCHQAIRREAFFETGGFHPELVKDKYIGDGETGLNEDIRKNGWLFAYVGTSVIYHRIPKKRMAQRYLNHRLEQQGNALSYREYRKKCFYKSDLGRLYFDYLKSYLKTVRECLVIYDMTVAWRFILANFYCCKARIIFDHQVVKDVNKRELVLQNDWLSD